MKVKSVNRHRKQLLKYVEEFKDLLGRQERQRWCFMYLSGLMLNGERKSIQPMSERLPGGNEQSMQQFVNQSPWLHQPILKRLSSYLYQKTSNKQGVLVLDDTGLPKKGKHSVGVARQYCGALGKVSNCQSIATWHYATKTQAHFPLTEQLYLPKEWIEDTCRLDKASVPKTNRKFKKKWELALELLKTIPREIKYEALVFDAGYGEIRAFLRKLDERNETFIAQVPESHSYWSLDVPLTHAQPKTGRRRRYPAVCDKKHKPKSASKWRLYLEKEQKTKWKKISVPLKSKTHVMVKAIRVKEVITEAFYRPGSERWLVIEKFGNEQFKYFVSNAPLDTPLKKMVNWIHQRWQIEQGYQQLKEELGLDHFEGRSWRGLHHHLTLCFMAYSFLYLLKLKNQKKISSINIASSTNMA